MLNDKLDFDVLSILINIAIVVIKYYIAKKEYRNIKKEYLETKNGRKGLGIWDASISNTKIKNANIQKNTKPQKKLNMAGKDGESAMSNRGCCWEKYRTATSTSVPINRCIKPFTFDLHFHFFQHHLTTFTFILLSFFVLWQIRWIVA